MFSRPPPPLATNGPICFPRPPMKPSPTGSDLSFHHHHPRITGPPGAQFPPGPNTPVFSGNFATFIENAIIYLTAIRKFEF